MPSPSPRLVSSSPRPPRFLRFGDFELDVRAGELRKHGTRLRLRTQTLQILLMLLEHPREVVLREEIRQRLWPGDTTVEFDHSINTAVQKLRDALGDSADAPRLIETLPKRGYRFLGEVERVGDEPGPVAVAVPREQTSERRADYQATRSAWSWRARIVAALMLLCLLASLIWLRPRGNNTSNRAPVRNWTMSFPGTNAVVSPDGTAVMYFNAGRLYYRRMDSLAEVPLAEPGALISNSPAWSPDSSNVVYLTFQGQVIRKHVPEGISATVCRVSGGDRGLAWGPGDTILLANIEEGEGRLFMVPATGGSPVRLETPGFEHGVFYRPEFLPNGKLLFGWATEADTEAGLFLATLDHGKFAGKPVLIRRNITPGHFSASAGGRLLYLKDDDLFAQKLDPDSGKLAGEPQRIVVGVASAEGPRRAYFSVSRNGVLTWTPGTQIVSQLTWFDRKGNALGTAGPACAISTVSLSHDEKHLLVNYAGRHSIIVEPHHSGYLTLPGVYNQPLWMPDSSHILYCRTDANQCHLMERLGASGEETELMRIPGVGSLRDVSPDGNSLLYFSHQTIDFAHIGGPPEPRHPQLGMASVHAHFSPDGRWIVYTARDADSQPQVFVRRFPSGGFPTQISTSGGDYPQWRGDGKEIVYFDKSTLYAVGVQTTSNEIRASRPEALFQARPFVVVGDAEPLAITRDGSQILVAQAPEGPGVRLTNVMTALDERLTR